MKKTHEAITSQDSSFSKYQDVVVGSRSWRSFLYYEWCMLLGPLPGALGMFLRKTFWPRLFGSCGGGVLFGSNIILRHPGRIKIGKSVVISEGCILDGRRSGEGRAILLGDEVILSNYVMLSCKEGQITIADCTGINARTIVQSTSNCPVEIGRDVVIGQGCLIIGGGNYNTNRMDIPIRLQGIKSDGGVKIEDDVWLGGNVTVLGGVVIGVGAVAAAGAVVTKSVAPWEIVAGVPARTISVRQKLDLDKLRDRFKQADS